MDLATRPTVVDPELLDLLVPPPGPRWRRVLAWVAFLALVSVVVLAVVTGTVVPAVDDAHVSSYGGRGPVQLGITAANASRVPIEVVDGSLGDRPGLRLIGYSVDGSAIDVDGRFDRAALDRDPFPIRLAPGQGLDLVAWFDVTDCSAIDRLDPADREVRLLVRIADGPVAVRTWTRSIGGVDDETGSVNAARTWVAAATTYAC